MEKGICISEIVETIRESGGEAEVCATAEAEYDAAQQRVSVALDSFALSANNHPAGEETCMNTLAKWSPFRELDALQNRLTTLFGRTPWRTTGEETFGVTEWTPLVDVTEDEKEYLIKVELPEMKQEDVKVTGEDGTLRITGEWKFEKEEKGKKYHRVERAYGSFERSFMLPEGTKPDKLNADYKDGVLKVHLPKSEEAKPKPLEVKHHRPDPRAQSQASSRLAARPRGQFCARRAARI